MDAARRSVAGRSVAENGRWKSGKIKDTRGSLRLCMQILQVHILGLRDPGTIAFLGLKSDGAELALVHDRQRSDELQRYLWAVSASGFPARCFSTALGAVRRLLEPTRTCHKETRGAYRGGCVKDGTFFATFLDCCCFVYFHMHRHTALLSSIWAATLVCAHCATPVQHLLLWH